MGWTKREPSWQRYLDPDLGRLDTEVASAV